MKNLLPYGLSLLLMEKGFDALTDFMWVNSYDVKDEILEKYPGLSDDGYYDLLKKNGGELDEDDVFGYKTETCHISCRNTKHILNVTDRYMVCSSPSISEVLEWLVSEKKTYINVKPFSDENGVHFEASYSVVVDNYKVDTTYIPEKFESYEEAFFRTIEEIIKTY